jgi:hypothetical protein
MSAVLWIRFAGSNAKVPTLSPPVGTAAAWRTTRTTFRAHTARAMPNFRAAFTIGGTNSDSCPQNYSRLKTEAACESLAAIAGASLGAIAGADMYAGRDEYSYYPAGCFRQTVTGKFYWNTHGNGTNNSFAQPLCAGALASHSHHDCRCEA